MFDNAGRPREAEVVVLWKRLALAGAVLRAETGERVCVIYPGRANDGRGADFTDVVVSIDGRRRRGDVEVHVKSSDWRSHGHHRDAVYDRVVLHVVMWNDASRGVLQSGGGRVPAVALETAVWPDDESEAAGMPCGRPRRDAACLDRPDARIDCIERAGVVRFFTKVDAFADDLARMTAGQALYCGIMGAFGYSRNKDAFLELANRAPLAVLESMTQAAGQADDPPSRLRDYLLAVAGLAGGAAGAANGWEENGETEVMPLSAWQFFRIRPAGSPARRLAAMGHLICRYRRRGLLAGLMTTVAEWAPEAPRHQNLEEARVVAGGDRGPALLGRRYAAEIVVNVLLPFTVAWARSEGDTGLERAARAAYLGYPSLPDNTVVRHMRRQLGLAGRDVASACRQQGLIHVYRARCTEGKCTGCRMIQTPERSSLARASNLRQLEAGNDVDI